MGTLSYNPSSDKGNLTTIFRATSGGTVFSANLASSTSLDLFTDTAVVDDAIYFGNTTGISRQQISDIYLDINTALVATTIELVWEYHAGAGSVTYQNRLGSDWSAARWRPIEDLEDDTVNFTVTGANAVKFPVQFGVQRATVNGTSNIWVRCRINSVTGLTEGGSVSAQIKRNYGRLYVESYTTAVPCSFDEIADYLNTNYSYITGLRAGTCFFDFRKIGIDINSPLVTKNEMVEVGNTLIGNESSHNSYWYNIYMGEKLGETMGRNGSVIIANGVTNCYPLNRVGPNCYGSVIKSRDGVSTGTGYFSFGATTGETIDCIQENNPGTLTGKWNGSVLRNWGVNILSQQETVDTYNNRMLLLANRFGLLYNASHPTPQTFNEWNFEMNANIVASFLTWTSATGGNIREFYNCTGAPLDESVRGTNGNPYWTDAYPYGYTDSAALSAITLLYYDDSAGTYTNYTTEADPTNASTFPLHGDVGDCFYIGNAGATIGGKEMRMWIDAQSNDYEYVFEEWSSDTSSWETWGTYKITIYAQTRTVDKTANFTKDGSVFFINTLRNGTATTIDGISKTWMRIRITSKGTGSPVAKGMRVIRNGQYQDQRFDFYFSFDYKVTDDSGTPLENAIVKVRDKDGNEVLSELTDANGETTSQYVMTDQVKYDPENFDRDAKSLGGTINNRYWCDCTTENKGPFSIYIGKTGYDTYYQIKDIGEKQNDMVALRPITERITIVDEVIPGVFKEL